ERHLPSPERTRRIRLAFGKAGKRLDACIPSKGTDLPQDSSLADLKSQWTQMNSKLEHLTNADTDTSDASMDLISQIEQQAQKECGNFGPDDRALLLLSARRRGAEQ